MSLIACRDCAAIQELRSPARGRTECWQCGRVLENRTGRSLDAALACSIATFLILLPANLLPLMTVRAAGLSSTTRLAAGLSTAWIEGWPLVTIVLGLEGIILPFVQFGLLSVTLAAIRLGVRDRRVGRAFRYCEILDLWAMVDVLLIGAGIGYGRLLSQTTVAIDSGGWCFVCAALMTMITRATLERRAVWRCLASPPGHAGPDAIACTGCDLVLPPEADGQRCPRCAARVHRRIPSSMLQTTALVLATSLLTPIAYGWPMSEFWKLGSPSPHSIINGIQMLFLHGFWYFGIVILMVSLVFPLTKLVGLTWFLTSVHNRSPRRLRQKTRLYRFIDEVGRWSTLDPFTVMIFAPMVQFGQLAHFDFMGGCPAFLATVVLSMLATRMFDPRLMWDAAQGPRTREAPPRVQAAQAWSPAPPAASWRA